MKITFHVFSLFTLLSVFSTISWASDVNPTSEAKLAENKDDGEYFINMQTSGKATLAITEGQIADGITSFKIYDDGGKNGNYSNGVNTILDITVPKGYKMELTGKVLTECFFEENCNDGLYVYEGETVLYQGGVEEECDADLNECEFVFTPVEQIYSSENTLTIQFNSDDATVYPGFDLNIKILDLTVKYDVTFSESDGKYPNATLQCVPCQAVFGDEVVITANARDGYGLKAVKVNGELENAVNNQVSLVMPLGGIVVEPVIEQLYSVTVAENPDATIKANLNKTFAGNTVWLEVYPKFGYALSDLMITDEDETDVNWKMDESGFIYYFDMPSRNVVVTPVVSAIKTVEGELQGTDEKYINMPRKDAVAVTIPADVKSFKVYDDGGKDGDYSEKSSGRLLLTAPDGYRMKVTGTVYTECEDPEFAGECWDYVIISDENGNNLYKGGVHVDDEDEFNQADIGTHTSTGNKMTLEFHSDAYEEYAGFEFTVTLEKIPVVNGAITIAGNTATIDGDYAGKDAFQITEPIEVEKVELKRTFPVLEGARYSTLFLPFSIGLDKVTGLEALYGFNYMEEGVNSLTVHMKTATSIQANTPYFVKLNDTKLSFEGPVTLEVPPEKVVVNGQWAFVGTYAYKKWTADDPELSACNGGSCVYGYAAKNDGHFEVGQFVKVGAGASIVPMRAYLVKQSMVSKAAPSPFGTDKSMVSAEKPLPDHIDIVIDDPNGQTTFVGRFNTRTGEFSKSRYNYTFDLKGRRVNGTNNARGYYVKKMSSTR